MAKHAGTVAGWALDKGADRKRRALGRPAYGKHGNGHVGARESRAMAALVRLNRSIGNKRSRHGIPATHPVAHRIIGASIGRRVVLNDGRIDYASAGIRHRVIVGA